MTEKEKDNKKKKLTLAMPKLSLGNKSLHSSLSNSGKRAGVVIEVNKGRASSNERLSLSTKTSKQNELDDDSNTRRMDALKRLRSQEDNPLKISTLSKLAQINKQPEIDSTTEETKHDREQKDQTHSIKPEAAIPTKPDANFSKKPLDKHSSAYQGKNSEKEEEKTSTTKLKLTEPKKLKKTDILHMLDEDMDDIPTRSRSLASIKRAREKEKRKNSGESARNKKLYREVIIPETILVSDLANRMSERVDDVILELNKLGEKLSANDTINADIAEIVVESLGHKAKIYRRSDVENILIKNQPSKANLKPRAPIVTVMGHVDHGKTSLLDALKSTDIAADEAGGITQHIAAYSVNISDNRAITFIDTPGHAAFTEMRSRGAQVTDIVVLVIAADDGIKVQTIEAINHIKAAKVPVIVAINKIDKPGADIDRIKNELLSHELVPEDFGGDVMTVGVSAKQKMNLDKLEESILLLSEMLGLKASFEGNASGVVIEARADSQQGVVVTLIVQQGTLKKGDIVIAGKYYGKVKKMCNDRAAEIQSAYPSIAVEIFGFSSAPAAGEVFNVVQAEKQARDIINYRTKLEREIQAVSTKSTLEEMFSKASGTNQQKELPIIVKGDVYGSIEAINNSLNKIESDEVKLKILHSAVGGIIDSDITLAHASGAIILGFNVRANSSIAQKALDKKVDIRYYSIIYNLIDDVKAIMSGMLSPIIRESYIGSVDIREVFNITKVGKIAGSYVTKGIIKRGAGVRLLRDDIVIHEGHLKTLKRFKDDVKEVREGFECGIAFENYSDIKVGDKVEVFEIVEEQQKL